MWLILHRLGERDRALYERWALPALGRARVCRVWTVITHLGGTTSSVLLATAPMLAGGDLAAAARLSFQTLAISHLLVQLVKRTVGRPRPSMADASAALVGEPDRFSFPSGHSAAAMSVAFGYGVTYPILAPVLVSGALLVGFSRICLRVHYPGDVLIGQLLAVGTGVGLLIVR
jgi:undecaprenyl-diphosphatase